MPNGFWLSRELFCWKPDVDLEGLRVVLHHDREAAMFISSEGVVGGEEIELTRRSGGLPPSASERFPHLAELPCFTTFIRVDEARTLATHQLVLAAYRRGALVDYASLQIPGALDDLFVWKGSLGVELSAGRPTLRVWAPTAQAVTLHLYASSADQLPARSIEMLPSRQYGVWTAALEQETVGLFYLYEVMLYVPSAGRIERNLVTDPYSISLGQDSRKSQIVDLRDPALVPLDWEALQKPPVPPADAVLYELHVRDFSAGDDTVPDELRGRYGAFSVASAGMRHLQQIAAAGVTHVHLLPINDFATASDQLREYNWGYDPLHWLAPEGSYSVEPDGSSRVREVREMIASLNRLGLRVVIDVVFNHTFASGEDDDSVVDRIVPGYYHRLDSDGVVLNSTCCSNTATEHAMMERLMIDAVVHWAREYRVDGFRFDLMGHHLKRNMLHVRDALRALTLESDGVDGASLLMYGEGWDFGEVAQGARGINATQLQMSGTGIATFNDRMRDALRGGSPFGEVHARGFATGSAEIPGDLNDVQFRLAAGLAGGLRDLVVETHGRQEHASRNHIGYAESPLDIVNYVSAHDNETLFDAIQLKAPETWSMDERVRMHNLATSMIALSQGIPFFHAGDEILRSKSGDRNSFASGDLYNRIDWSMNTHNWGVSLPPKSDNQAAWPLLERLFRDPATRPAEQHMRRAFDHFLEILAIRRSSALFRLGERERVLQATRFDIDMHGVVAMRLRGESEEFMLVFNARNDAVDVQLDATTVDMPLHPVLATSSDPIVRGAFRRGGRMFVPARTTAVFAR